MDASFFAASSAHEANPFLTSSRRPPVPPRKSPFLSAEETFFDPSASRIGFFLIYAPFLKLDSAAFQQFPLIVTPVFYLRLPPPSGMEKLYPVPDAL